jgi:ABC-type uncharacterized transport system substrate-binding protein
MSLFIESEVKIVETIETLQELDELFSETMLCEFADNENAPGNRRIVEHLKQKNYTNKQIATLRSVIHTDTMRNGW